MSDTGRRSSVQFIKPAIKVIQSVRKVSVGSRSVLGRRLVVRYGLQSLPNVLGVVGGQILFKFVTEDMGCREEDMGCSEEDMGWREEDMGWREEDMGWREEDMGWR